MYVDTLTSVDELRKIAPRWQELCNLSRKGIPFQAPGWVIPWIERFELEQSLRVLCAMDDGSLIGVLPLMLSEGRLSFCGAGLNDTEGLVVLPAREAEVAFLMARKIFDDLGPWRDLEFSCLFRSNFSRALEERASERGMCRGLPKPSVHLPARVSSRARYRVRRLLAHRDAVFEVSDTPIAVRANIQHLLRLRRDLIRQRGLLETYARDSHGCDFEAFVTVAAERMAESGHGIILTLREKGSAEIIAAQLGFCVHRRLLLYLGGWDYEYRTYSPGSVLDVLSLDYAAASGFEVVDFGRGDEPYKFKFGSRKEADVVEFSVCR